MKKKKVRIDKHILEAKAALRQIMHDNLAKIASAMIKQIMGRSRKLTPSQLVSAIKNVDKPGVTDYKNELKTALALIASDAIVQIRKEIPKAKKIKLGEGLNEYTDFMLSEFDDLPKKLQQRIILESQAIVGTQLGDLESTLTFQFANSYDSTDSMDTLEGDLNNAADDMITGASIEAGSGISAAEIINSARSAFYMDDDVTDQLDALQFVNGDPVTTICQRLDGVIFDANDPLADRFQPPFHWNCKTYIIPILKGNLGKGDEVEDLSAYADLESEMQFSESNFQQKILLSEPLKHTH